eukprot:11161183-Lingulodinium_polyedra.AAC.1
MRHAQFRNCDCNSSSTATASASSASAASAASAAAAAHPRVESGRRSLCSCALTLQASTHCRTSSR